MDTAKRLLIAIGERAVPKGRPRFTRAGHAYTPARTRAWEERVAYGYKQAVAGQIRWGRIEEGPVGLGVICESVGFWGNTDFDNLIKAISDGLNGLAFVDDRQIECIHACRISKARDLTMIAVCRPVAGQRFGETVDEALDEMQYMFRKWVSGAVVMRTPEQALEAIGAKSEG